VGDRVDERQGGASGPGGAELGRDGTLRVPITSSALVTAISIADACGLAPGWSRDRTSATFYPECSARMFGYVAATGVPRCDQRAGSAAPAAANRAVSVAADGAVGDRAGLAPGSDRPPARPGLPASPHSRRQNHSLETRQVPGRNHPSRDQALHEPGRKPVWASLSFNLRLCSGVAVDQSAVTKSGYDG
jgi:hypothetical protein